METTVVRRGRKPAPPFSLLEHKGNVKEISPIGWRWTGRGNGLKISPYSSLIPISYIYNSSFPRLSLSNSDRIVIQKLLMKPRKSYCFEQIMKKFARHDKIFPLFENELFFDEQKTVNADYSHSLWHTNVQRYFKGEEETTGRISMRSWRGMIDILSFYVKEENYIPHIIGVCLPENYLYHRIRAMLGLPLDLSKVEILMNRELDTPRFVRKPVRKYYRDNIKETLLSLNCNIWEVPHSFIMENVFIQRYKLQGKRISEKKREIEALAKLFLSQNTESNSDGIRLDSPGIYQQLMDAAGAITLDRPEIRLHMPRYNPQYPISQSEAFQSNIISSDGVSYSTEGSWPSRYFTGIDNGTTSSSG